MLAPKKDKFPPPSSTPTKSGGGKQKKKINGLLARKAIRDLMAKGKIKMVSTHSSQQIYTTATHN